jgi:hypothetical protein
MARFTSAGALDTSYGGANSGWATITFPPDASVIYGFRLQPDDKAVIPVNWPDNGSNADGPTTDQAVLRFTATGLLDTTFGPSGTGLSQLGGWIGQVDSCRGLVVDLQGRIIIAGTHSTLETSALADPTRGIELTAFHQ